MTFGLGRTIAAHVLAGTAIGVASGVATEYFDLDEKLTTRSMDGRVASMIAALPLATLVPFALPPRTRVPGAFVFVAPLATAVAHLGAYALSGVVREVWSTRTMRDPIVNSVIGTYELRDGRQAEVRVESMLARSFDTRREAIAGARAFDDRQLAVIGVQRDGQRAATWRLASISATDGTGRPVPLHELEMYDDINRADADGRIVEHTWRDTPGDGARLAGVYEGAAGFLVAMPGEESRIDIDVTQLAPGS